MRIGFTEGRGDVGGGIGGGGVERVRRTERDCYLQRALKPIQMINVVRFLSFGLRRMKKNTTDFTTYPVRFLMPVVWFD